ncbi:MAG: carbohydrate binding family 9 domain-containing protein [bacterium]|nr:carbohydrate binding family 9 domain-containing protein [bacterium]
MWFKLIIFWCFVVFVVTGYTKLYVAHAANTITAVRVEKGPHLDGKLDDAVWQLAEPASNFIQRSPENGDPETEKTEVRLVYDHKALYVAGWCWDSQPDKISAYGLRRDFDPSAEDAFVIALDTYRDRRNCYYLGTNANGALYDALGAQDGMYFNPNWNGVWDCRGSRDDKGWYVEMMIPFSTLRFTEDSIQVWGVNFERDVQRNNEFDFWQPLLPNQEATVVSRAGTLLGLKNIQRGNDIEIKPYGVGGFTKLYPDYGDDQIEVTKAGIDIKMPLTSTLTLDLTTNPDYSQIEDDRPIINLSRVPQFQGERREFFLEGGGTFNFNFSDTPNLFYSRRIGFSPNGTPIPILGGARVTGSVGKYNIGVLTMQTAEKGTIPSTNYSVARVKRNVLRQSYIGVMATNKEESSRYNRVFGADALLKYDHVLGDNYFQHGGAFAMSKTPELVGRNTAWRYFIESPNDQIYSFVSYRSVEENFNPEIGYNTRYGRKFATQFTYAIRPTQHGFRRIAFTPFIIDRYWDVNGRQESQYYTLGGLSATLNSGDYAEVNFNRSYERFDYSFPLIGNAFIESGEHWYNEGRINLGTSSQREGFVYSEYTFGGFYQGTHRSLYSSANWRLNQHFTLSGDYTRNDIELSGVRVTTSDYGSRVRYAYSTRADGSLFGQWNNQSKKLNMNFRWHWMPNLGSDVYLAYNQRFDTVGRVKPVDATVLCKVTYRIVV